MCRAPGVNKSWGVQEIEGGSTYGLSADGVHCAVQKNNLKMISIGAGFEE
ncbi:MAG: hypothetical protein IPK96_21725, partial [Flammeovirgaceae bacterium]|nr:hypothetical protein [Flammeovirgaceae bacterium]